MGLPRIGIIGDPKEGSYFGTERRDEERVFALFIADQCC